MFRVIILLLTVRSACSLTCQELKDSSNNSSIKLFVLKALKQKEIVDCLPYLGSIKLKVPEAEFIWQSIINFHKGISKIPDEVLLLLRWVIIAVKPEDYLHLTLSDIEVITNFGLDYGLSNDQLLAIAKRVREDFGRKLPEDYTTYDLTALRQILCVFDGKEIRRIHPKPYKETAFVLRDLQKCNYDVLEGFARLAVDRDAFGSPDTWERETICIMGVVAKYLPEEIISKLKKKLGNDILKEADKNVTREKDCY